MIRFTSGVFLLIWISLASFVANGKEIPRGFPVAMSWVNPTEIAVALRDAREIAIVDLPAKRVRDRWPLPFAPASIDGAHEDGTIVVGGMGGELAIIDTLGRVVQHQRVGRGPVRVLAMDLKRVATAALWDHELLVLIREDLRPIARHPLGFSVGALCRLPGGEIVASDAFGSWMGKLVPEHPEQDQFRKMDGVNLRAMAVSGDSRELLVVHMDQESSGPINRTSIDWGLVFSSKLTAFRLSEFANHSEDRNVRRLTLDGSRNGAADPSAITLSPDGNLIVMTSAGAHRLLKVDRRLGPKPAEDLLSLGNSLKIVECEVGEGPRSLLVSQDGRHVISADAFGDTLSIVDLETFQKTTTIPLGSGSEGISPAQRGEALFHDGRASLDRWMSCASCHPAGHTTGLNFDTLGDGDHGDAKNTPSLLGVRETGPFAWTGRFPKLHDQVRSSLESSQHGPIATSSQVEDLVAYLGSLDPAPPLRDPEDSLAKRGAELFATRNCASCHKPPTYTSPSLRDVGLRDRLEKSTRYNPPSLRGVSRSAPYFHDGRAASLADVLRDHHPGFDAPLPDDQRLALAAFLESL